MLQALKPKVEKLLLTASPPHAHSRRSVGDFFWSTLGALIPIWIWSWFLLGWNSFRLAFVALASSFIFEAGYKWFSRTRFSFRDGSTALYAFLLALSLPADLPSTLVILGAFIAVIIGKSLYGGLGQNVFHPVHAARAVLFAAFPYEMTRWATSGVSRMNVDLSQPFFGHISPSSVGGVSIFAILIGGAILIFRRCFRWEMTCSHLLALWFGALLLGWNPVQTIFRGDVLFAAFFLITDWVTSPITFWGRVLFSVSTAACVLLISRTCSYFEAISYVILMANAFVPLIDWHFRPKR